MHLPKVAGKYLNSPFFKMAANAILKIRKSDIAWTKYATKADEETFYTKFDITDLIERKSLTMFWDHVDL